MSFDFKGPYPSREEITRDRLMDACILAIGQHGLSKLKIKHIVEISGVSRQTLYNYYKNREALIQEAFLREGIKLSEMVIQEIRRYTDLEDKFVKGWLFVYENLPQNPILNLLVDPESALYSIVGLSHYPFEYFGRLCFSEIFEEHPELLDDAADIGELWSRNLMSFLLMKDDERSLDDIEAFVRKRLVPGLYLDELRSDSSK